MKKKGILKLSPPYGSVIAQHNFLYSLPRFAILRKHLHKHANNTVRSTANELTCFTHFYNELHEKPKTFFI